VTHCWSSWTGQAMCIRCTAGGAGCHSLQVEWQHILGHTRPAPVGLGVSNHAGPSIAKSSPSSSLPSAHATAVVAPPSTCATLGGAPTSPLPPPSGTLIQLQCPMSTPSCRSCCHVFADDGVAGTDEDSFAKAMRGKAAHKLDS
jgi:hypothetical protein